MESIPLIPPTGTIKTTLDRNQIYLALKSRRGSIMRLAAACDALQPVVTQVLQGRYGRPGAETLSGRILDTAEQMAREILAGAE